LVDRYFVEYLSHVLFVLSSFMTYQQI
jgi:hypothetical protein